MIDAEFLKPVRAFAMLDMSKSSGYAALQRGDIPHVRIAGQIRIPRRWIDEQVRRAVAGGHDQPGPARLGRGDSHG